MNHDVDRIMRKIKSCLALARSNNSSEAAVALRQAQLLMEKYNISQDSIQAANVNSEIKRSNTGKKPPLHISMLVSMIMDVFGVGSIYRATRKSSNWCGEVEFYGVGSSAQIAAYAFDVLSRQLRRDRSVYINNLNNRLKRATKIRRGDLYAQGWIHAVNEKLIPHHSTEQEIKALNSYKFQRWGDSLSKGKSINRSNQCKSYDVNSFSEGFTDGKKINYHKGVSAVSIPKIGDKS